MLQDTIVVFALKSYFMASKLRVIFFFTLFPFFFAERFINGSLQGFPWGGKFILFFCLLVSCTTNERRKAHFTTEHKTLPTLAISASSSTSTSSTMTLDGANRVSTV